MKARAQWVLLWALLALAASTVSCTRFHPQPLSPVQNAAELQSRSLTNAALKVFVEKNLRREFTDWPAMAWDFEMLTFAAFYYHPDLAVARAQWQVARAGVKTAGGRPNPTLTLAPGYNTTLSVPSPWFPAVTLDVPLETAGKRGHRVDAAEQVSESARFNLATTAWQVRSRLRSSLVDFAAARQREERLKELTSIQQQIVELTEQQVTAGAMAGPDAALPRVILQKLIVERLDAQRQTADARIRVAEAIGIPSGSLYNSTSSEADAPKLAFDPLADPPAATNLVSADIRRIALQSRTDILAALADYAAAQANLQTEIAKQYPDVHLSPGYQYDQGENKWSVGITFELPLLNRNQGPIAEATARRTEAAARFNVVQSKALGEIERAIQAFGITLTNADTLQSLAGVEAGRRDSVEAQFKAGAVDRLQVLSARFEFAIAELGRQDAQVKLQQAVGALEDAVQRPISGEPWPSSAVEWATVHSSK